jgi:FMN-dependent NADH-azoreductase
MCSSRAAGIYGGEHDTQAPYLRQFLRFIGIESEFVFAQGLAYGEESRQKSLALHTSRSQGSFRCRVAA